MTRKLRELPAPDGSGNVLAWGNGVAQIKEPHIGVFMCANSAQIVQYAATYFDLLENPYEPEPPKDAVVERIRKWLVDGTRAKAVATELRAIITSEAPPLTVLGGWYNIYKDGMGPRQSDEATARKRVVTDNVLHTAVRLAVVDESARGRVTLGSASISDLVAELEKRGARTMKTHVDCVSFFTLEVRDG